MGRTESRKNFLVVICVLFDFLLKFYLCLWNLRERSERDVPRNECELISVFFFHNFSFSGSKVMISFSVLWAMDTATTTISLSIMFFVVVIIAINRLFTQFQNGYYYEEWWFKLIWYRCGDTCAWKAIRIACLWYYNQWWLRLHNIECGNSNSWRRIESDWPRPILSNIVKLTQLEHGCLYRIEKIFLAYFVK